uniref:Cytochrome P450, family 2, subfamily X, polypeptide 9 n=1 Tax=Astyanax mexicanus TaxID=7994 RepID=A0A8B9HPD2_ASTMX
MLGSLFLVWGFICLIFLFIRIQRPKNFPPGPRPVPIFGNLFQLNITNPLKDFDKFAERYGNVYSLYFGGRPAVILNGFKAVKEALVTKAADFSGRPQNILISDVTKGKGVIFVDYNSEWKEHRRFALTTLRNFGMGKQSMEERILGETEHLVECLEKSVGNLMSGLLYYSIITKRAFTSSFLQIYDTFPFLRGLPLPFKKAVANFEVLKMITSKMIDKYKPSRVQGEQENFVEKCLHFNPPENAVNHIFSSTTCNIVDLHAAGTDTTSNTLLTAFLYLITHPDIQEGCQQEIDEVLEGKAHVSFEDRQKMPYVQAVMHESQRFGSTVPLSVPHCTTRDTELMGYSIPKGTVIYPNLYSVLNEESQWKFPHKFNPANFLNEKGQFEKPEAFMPFSVGPRSCLGEGLARMELFLILVTLLRRFQFFWPENAGEPDFTPVYGITLTPKPYRMGIRLRQPVR